MEPAKWFNVMCCRACLATDCKLYNMHEHNLVEEFVRVTGFDVRELDQFPQHICVLCSSVLQRCASFRAKCLRAALCLLPHLKNGKLTTDSVRNVDRIANKFVDLAVNEIEITDSSNIPISLQHWRYNDLDIETEREIKQETDTNILQENLKNETSEETFVDHLDFSEYDNFGTEETFVDHLDFSEYDNFGTEETFVDHLDFSEYDNFGTTSNIELNVSSISTKNDHKSTKNKTIKVSRKSEMTKADNLVNEKGIKRNTKLEKHLVPVQRKRRKKSSQLKTAGEDWEKFEETYNVKIKTLSLTEQLAIIESRRTSDGYRAAPFQCQPCGKHFGIEEMYNRHMANHTKEAGKYECPTCTLRFKLHNRCREHNDQHRFQIVCRECGFISRNRFQAKSHHEFHVGKTFTCEYCGKVFRKYSSCFTHIRLSHPMLNLVCNMCGETFVNDEGLTIHKTKMHRVPKKDKHRECKMCSVIFSSLDALEKHRDTAGDHADLKPCIQCGGNFDSEDKLQEHVKAKHPHCDECKLTFINGDSFDIHYRRKHLGRGRPGSEKAKEANRRARALGLPLPYPPCREKKRKITDADKARGCCDKCGKMFRFQCFLKYHQCSGHQSEKMFECNECQKKFSFKSHLENHLRIHTGEKPFQCPQCPRAFSFKNNFERHRKVTHLNIRGRYPCVICGRALTTSWCLRVHIKEVHGGDRPKRIRKRKREKMLKECVDSDLTE